MTLAYQRDRRGRVVSLTVCENAAHGEDADKMCIILFTANAELYNQRWSLFIPSGCCSSALDILLISGDRPEGVKNKETNSQSDQQEDVIKFPLLLL